MYLFKNLPISYKLFIGFLLIWIIFFVYVMYLLSASKTFYQSLSQLDTHSDKRVLYSTLNLETIQLSNAVKSYMLTRDPRWEKVYDTTSSQLQTNLTTLATISTSD